MSRTGPPPGEGPSLGASGLDPRPAPLWEGVTGGLPSRLRRTTPVSSLPRTLLSPFLPPLLLEGTPSQLPQALNLGSPPPTATRRRRLGFLSAALCNPLPHLLRFRPPHDCGYTIASWSPPAPSPPRVPLSTAYQRALSSPRPPPPAASTCDPDSSGSLLLLNPKGGWRWGAVMCGVAPPPQP